MTASSTPIGSALAADRLALQEPADDVRVRSSAGRAMLAAMTVLPHVLLLALLAAAWRIGWADLGTWCTTAVMSVLTACVHAVLRTQAPRWRLSDADVSLAAVGVGMLPGIYAAASVGSDFARVAVLAAGLAPMAIGSLSLDRRRYALLVGLFVLACVVAFEVARHNGRTQAPPAQALIVLAMAAGTAMQMGLIGAYLYSLRMKLHHRSRELTEASQRLERMALVDDLTGLPNRTSLTQRLAIEFARADRTAQGLSVGIVDVDHFKRINDTFGHAAGDEVLRRIGRQAQYVMRAADAFGRWGGEEFLLIVSDGGADGGRRCAERLRAAIAEMKVDDVLGDGASVTVSIGVAAWRGSATVPQALSAADQALYRAKAGGRNRVETAA